MHLANRYLLEELLIQRDIHKKKCVAWIQVQNNAENERIWISPLFCLRNIINMLFEKMTKVLMERLYKSISPLKIYLSNLICNTVTHCVLLSVCVCVCVWTVTTEGNIQYSTIGILSQNYLFQSKKYIFYHWSIFFLKLIYF